MVSTGDFPRPMQNLITVTAQLIVTRWRHHFLTLLVKTLAKFDVKKQHMVGDNQDQKFGNPDHPPPPHPPVEQDVLCIKMFSNVCSFWNCRHKLA